MDFPLDVLKKLDEVSFQWVEAAPDLQGAAARIEKLEARSPGEYVVFDRRIRRVIARFTLATALQT